MDTTNIIKMQILLRRGTWSQWEQYKTVVPAAGEPCFITDKNILKIGDGHTQFQYLEPINGVKLDADNKSLVFDGNALKLAGFDSAEVGAQPRKAKDGSLEWVVPSVDSNDDFEDVMNRINDLEKQTKMFEHTKYEITHKPAGTVVTYKDNEIRIMCPEGTKFESQNSGESADVDSYYIGFKAYAPDGAMSFKEDLAEIIADNTMYYFEGNDFAGTDEFGRKYSIVWLPVAKLVNGVWEYHGKKSTTSKYIGWHYAVEWYDKDGVKFSTDCIRLNLSNESCHNAVKPYYMSDYVTNKTYDEFVQNVNLQNASANQIPYMGSDGKLSWSNIALRRDNDYNYKKIENTFIPANGEVCLVDVAGYGLRVKIGNGINTFAELSYENIGGSQIGNDVVARGYFYQNNFYVDAAHTELMTAEINRIYIDVISSKIYTYDGVNYTTHNGGMLNATSDVAGAMKLYDQLGQNTDGTVTQRTITNELNEKFEMDVIEEEEMIVFDTDIN